MHDTPPRSFVLSDFDFHLPPELIAQTPAPERSASRLLDGRGAVPLDRIFKDLPALLQKGDLLVFNDTQVVPAKNPAAGNWSYWWSGSCLLWMDSHPTKWWRT